MRLKHLIVSSVLLSSLSAFAASNGEEKAYLERGIQSFEAGENKEAQSFFQESISHNAKDDQAVMWLGKTYAADKYYDKAQKEYQKALILNPKNAEASFLLGKIYFERKDYGNAKGYLEKSVSLQASNAPAFAMLGTIYAAEKDSSKAKNAFKKASKIDRSNEPLLLYYLARIEEQKGDMNKAKEYLKKLLTVDPKYPQAIKMLEKMNPPAPAASPSPAQAQ